MMGPASRGIHIACVHRVMGAALAGIFCLGAYAGDFVFEDRGEQRRIFDHGRQVSDKDSNSWHVRSAPASGSTGTPG